MSDNWGHYVADMGGHTASIVFDHGIVSDIKSLPENISYLITVPLQDMNESRMPTDAEAERLQNLQGGLDNLFEKEGGYSVGRVTSNGKRYCFYYVKTKTDELGKALAKVGHDLEYELSIGVSDDPEKKTYFDDLYPDPESYQVMMDMNVISILMDRGDDITAERRVDHMSVFPTKVGAQTYADWAKTAGYQVDPIRKEGLIFKRTFYVDTHNVTAVTVYAINPHSLGHFRKAAEFGGEYDGWGCTTVPISEQ